MIKKILIGAFAFAFLIAPAVNAQTRPEKAKEATESKQEKVFNAKSYRLENGLQLIVVENHRAPVITHMVWYRGGAADEPVGKSGIAHFLEHLMFKGQESKELGNIAPGEFSKTIRALGGEDNAFTSQDYTAYFQSIASDQLETVMKMEAGRMRGLNPPPKEFASENLVILEERRQRTDNDPKSQMGEQLNEALFPNHPYAKPVIGWLHEMKALTWADAKAFYDIYYAPNNAIVVVSGDTTGEEVLKIAKRTYGLMKKRDVPARVRPTSPPFVAKTSVSFMHETVKEPVFMRIYRAPSYRQNATDSLALEILQEIIGHGPPSRLYKSLVMNQKIATSVDFDYSSSAWDDATIEVSAIPADGKTLEDVRKSIDEELRKLVKDGVTDTELSEAVSRMQAAAIYARDSLSGPAMTIGYSMITGATLDDIEYWPRNIGKITKDQILDVAKRYLNPDAPSLTPPVEGFLLPKNSTQEGIR